VRAFEKILHSSSNHNSRKYPCPPADSRARVTVARDDFHDFPRPLRRFDDENDAKSARERARRRRSFIRRASPPFAFVRRSMRRMITTRSRAAGREAIARERIARRFSCD